jgi:hypothetical protein
MNQVDAERRGRVASDWPDFVAALAGVAVEGLRGDRDAPDRTGVQVSALRGPVVTLSTAFAQSPSSRKWRGRP